MKYIIFISHPIQYFTPLFAQMEKKRFLTEVWYGSRHGIDKILDKEFNTTFSWDIDLLQGYISRFLSNWSLKPGPYGFWGIVNPGVIKLLFSQEKSIILIHGWSYFTNWIIILFAPLLGHRLALKAETPQVHENQRSGFLFKSSRFLLKWLLFKRLDEAHYIGSQNKLFYTEMGVPEEKLIFTPYSVDNDRFKSQAQNLIGEKLNLREKYSIPNAKRVFIFSGKYIHKKRPMDLLKAIQLLSEKDIKNSYFIFMGEGKLRIEMEDFIQQEKLNNVLLTGFINQRSVADFYALSDIFIMCSGLGETWGLSTNEAMNFGLPVILSDLTGSSYDLIDGNGYQFETGNIEELSSVISKMIQLENSEIINYGEKSRELVSKYTYDVIVTSLKISLE